MTGGGGGREGGTDVGRHGVIFSLCYWLLLNHLEISKNGRHSKNNMRLTFRNCLTARIFLLFRYIFGGYACAWGA